MTSQNFSPATSDSTGADRPRRSRGGRGRGGRPAGDPQNQNHSRPQTAPASAPVVVPVGADATVLPTDTTFAALGVPAPLVEVLTASGITSPFPIQVATLPDSLAGKDVLGRGRTGSGKTLAFSLPLVARLAASTTKRQPKRPRSLILVPTRELANQVAAVVDPMARALGMKTTTIFGLSAASTRKTWWVMVETGATAGSTEWVVGLDR